MLKSPYQIVRRPILTEKSMKPVGDRNVYTFEVAQRANKMEIKKAIQDIFQVSVVKVNVSSVKGKKRRMRLVEGKRRDWKKAMVTLKKGDAIELT